MSWNESVLKQLFCEFNLSAEQAATIAMIPLEAAASVLMKLQARPSCGCRD